MLKDKRGSWLFNGWLSVLLAGCAIALVLKIFGIQLAGRRGVFMSILPMLVLSTVIASFVSARIRETLKIAASNILLLPSPLIGAARLFGYLVLGVYYKAFEAGMLSAQGSFSHQITPVIAVGIFFAVMYWTAGKTLVDAWQSAGRLTSLRGGFKSATKGFPKELMHRSGPWAAMAINPATRSVVLQARALINGTTANQPNELITLSFDDIADVGFVSPGYGFKGVLAGAGYQALAASAVIALNDLTQQRIAGAFDTGVWFRTRNKDAFLVQTDERDMQELAGIVGKAIF